MVVREGKQFFFEKKNQKTFVPLGATLWEVRRQQDQKSFASFLQKRRPWLLDTRELSADSSRVP